MKTSLNLCSSSSSVCVDLSALNSLRHNDLNMIIGEYCVKSYCSVLIGDGNFVRNPLHDWLDSYYWKPANVRWEILDTEFTLFPVLCWCHLQSFTMKFCSSSSLQSCTCSNTQVVAASVFVLTMYLRLQAECDSKKKRRGFFPYLYSNSSLQTSECWWNYPYTFSLNLIGMIRGLAMSSYMNSNLSNWTPSHHRWTRLVSSTSKSKRQLLFSFFLLGVPSDGNPCLPLCLVLLLDQVTHHRMRGQDPKQEGILKLQSSETIMSTHSIKITRHPN